MATSLAAANAAPATAAAIDQLTQAFEDAERLTYTALIRSQ